MDLGSFFINKYKINNMNELEQEERLQKLSLAMEAAMKSLHSLMKANNPMNKAIEARIPKRNLRSLDNILNKVMLQLSEEGFNEQEIADFLIDRAIRAL